MPTIDSENRKQIRQPMDVLITMPLAADGISLSFSGYSSAKVADGVLNRRSWPMRKLADLQGSGFELDGSAVIYNPNTTASWANGKIGVRGNIGESVSVTVTGNKSIPALSISVTGAASVAYNGMTKSITGSSVSVPVLTTSITLSFEPVSESERIEISNIEPETDFVINNENLIRATVSLRSDLSPFNQTLPESEINIEVYHPVDVAEDVVNIPADTPITYSAGYPGDMSPERKFYVAGQVRWSNNVLTIQGVDAVHFLDYNTEAAWWIQGTHGVPGVARRVLECSGFDYKSSQYMPYDYTGLQLIIPPGKTAREIIATLNWAIRIRGRTSSFRQSAFWFCYTDAGIPQYIIDSEPPDSKWWILEEDCADIVKKPEIPIKSFRVKTKDVIRIYDYNEITPARIGTANWVKNVGVTLSFEKLCDEYVYGVDNGDNFDSAAADKVSEYYRQASASWCVMDVGPGDRDGYQNGHADWGIDFQLLFGPDMTEENYDRISEFAPQNETFVAFVPWGAKYRSNEFKIGSRWVTSMAAAWKAYKDAGVMGDDAINLELTICGNGFDTYDATKIIAGGALNGEVCEIDSPLWGEGTASGMGTLYPNGVFESRLQDSNITGSFTWKGNPKMQPRDVVEWERLDGTTELITLENITLIHESGGLSAEITYRKGVV